jgi:hypothetical protein
MVLAGQFLTQNNYMKIKIIGQEIFYFLTASLIVFSLMEFIKPRIVLAYFNLSWLVLVWLVSALAVLLIDRRR